MTCFEMILQVATAVGTVGAVVVGMWAIISSNANNRKQIKIGKIEEVYELTSHLFYFYSEMKGLHLLIKSHQEIPDSVQKDNSWGVYQGRLNAFREVVNTIELAHKIQRLKILANSYLKGKLKLKVLVYVDLFECLFRDSMNGIQLITFYEEGYPDIIKLQKYLEDLHEDFVDEISIGEKSVRTNEIVKYRDDVFKYEIGLKNK